MSDAYVLRLPYDRPPLTANQRLHYRTKARITSEVRYTVAELARAEALPRVDRCRVILVWTVNSRHRRDEDNVVPTLKPICDGLVDAGVVDDDTPDRMTKDMPIIAYFSRHERPAALDVVILPIDEEPTERDRLIARLEAHLSQENTP